MHWELTLVEHESKFSQVVANSVKTAAMRTMLPKDILERFLDGPFNYEELRNRVSAYVGEKLAGQEASGGAQPMDIGHIDKSEGEDEDVNAVQRSCVTDACFFLQFWPRCFAVFPSFVHLSRDLRLLHMTTSWLNSKQHPSIHHISSTW